MQNSRVLYGHHPAMEALNSGEAIEKIYLLQAPHHSGESTRIRRAAEAEGIPVLFAPREKLEKLSGTRNHQGVVAVLSSHAYSTSEEILEDAFERKKIVLVLDHVEDPQNLGSLLRTCDSVGIVSGVLIPKRRAAGLTAGAAKASAGAIQHIKVARVSNLHHELLTLRKQGFPIIGTSKATGENYRQAVYPTGPLAVVLGNEHKGLSLLIKNTCDKLVQIPMRGHLDSLNVSVAGALVLYEILSQRLSAAPG